MSARSSGELLLLLTDGIVETAGPDEKFFGIKRVLDVVRAHQGQTAQEIIHTLYDAVRTFCGFQTQLDDMTAIVIKATSAPGPVAAVPT